ncbi:hypothetical protein [Terasakiella sp.]|uniref:hypothetical protein n=1 Tax=Terasakiella sp. TaxID=2034861 RepID=UPI003AA869E7
MTEITSPEDFGEWLKGQDRQVAIGMAARIALRVLPIEEKGLFQNVSSIFVQEVLIYFHVSATAWTSSLNSDKHLDVRKEAVFFAHSLTSDELYGCVADAVISESSYLYSSKVASISHSLLSVHAMESGFLLEIFEEIANDVDFLKEGNSISELMLRPLFSTELQSILQQYWGNLKNKLLSLNENWQVWTNWYEDRLVGGPRPNGRLVIEALERERVLLPDEDWEKGAAHVNALIVEMEKRYRMPEPPVQRLAEIMLQVGDDDKVHIQPHPLTSRDAVQDKRWHDAWDGLRDAVEDFVHYVPEGNNRVLDRAVRRYQEALSSHFENLNVIKLGQTGNRLSELLQRAKDELMDDVAAELAALLVNHNDFIKQVPEWRDYQKDADTGVAKSDVDFAREVVGQLDDQGDLLDDDVIEEFKTYADFLFDDYVPQEDDKTVVSDPVVVDFVRSVGNLLSVVAKPVVDCARKVRVGVDALNRKAFEWRAQRFLIQLEDMGLMDMLIAYAGSSSEFAWLAPIIAYLRGKMRD